MEKILYTTKEIAKLYGVTDHTITQTWIQNGLKYLKGCRHSYLYKKEWIEEYIENNIMSKSENIENIFNIKKSNRKPKNIKYVV